MVSKGRYLSKKIIFYGDNRDIHRILESKIQKFTNSQQIIDFFPSTQDYKKLIELLTSDFYNCLLIDFESTTEKILSLLSMLYFENKHRKAFTIGLWKNEVSEKVLLNSQDMGVDLHFFVLSKDSIDDIAFLTAKLIDIPVKPSRYHTVTLNKPAKALSPLRVNTITTEALQVESNFELELKSRVNIKTNFFKGFPTDTYQIIQKSNENLFYNKIWSYQCSYCFYNKQGELIQHKYTDEEEIDYIESKLEQRGLGDNANNNTVAEILEEFNANRNMAEEKRFGVEKWISNNKMLVRDEPPRILIIDSNLKSFSDSSKPIWEYPYKFYIVRSLESYTNIVDICGANFMAIEIPSTSEGQSNTSLNDLFKVINTLKEKEKTDTKVLIFNSRYTQDEMKEVLEYKNLYTFPHSFKFQSLIEYVRKEMNQKPNEKNFFDKKITSLQIQRSHDASFANLEIDIGLIDLSEDEVTFTSNYEIPQHSTLKILYKDAEFICTIYKTKLEGTKKIKKALVHSMREIEKSKFRKIIYKLGT